MHLKYTGKKNTNKRVCINSKFNIDKICRVQWNRNVLTTQNQKSTQTLYVLKTIIYKVIYKTHYGIVIINLEIHFRKYLFNKIAEYPQTNAVIPKLFQLLSLIDNFS